MYVDPELGENTHRAHGQSWPAVRYRATHTVLEYSTFPQILRSIYSYT